MTIREYTTQLFRNGFGFDVTEPELLRMSKLNHFDLNDEITDENMRVVDIANIRLVPFLLLRPENVAEGGWSITRAKKDAILEWYKQMCTENGLENTYRPKVRFRN
jgi:hypothetical protein